MATSESPLAHICPSVQLVKIVDAMNALGLAYLPIQSPLLAFALIAWKLDGSPEKCMGVSCGLVEFDTELLAQATLLRDRALELAGQCELFVESTKEGKHRA